MKPLMRLNDEELASLLVNLESDRVERKSSWRGDVPDKARQAVCAFANDLPDHRLPGLLIVGANDDGTPADLDIDDRLLQTLSDIKTDGKILPSPTLTVERRELSGHAYAVVTVQPSDSPPVRYDGRIWIRIGPRRAVATRQDEQILNDRRRHRDIPFDLYPLRDARLSDLNLQFFLNDYLPSAFAPSILDANERTIEERLASLKMIAQLDDPSPTIVGMLVLGKSTRDWIPGAYVQFLRVDGEHLSDDIRDSAEIDGPIAQMLGRLDDKIDAHIERSVDIVSGSKEQVAFTYPRAALQQLARNAVMHRTYQNSNAPIRFTWYSDRVEIISPGGPFGSVTTKNFGRAGLTDYRNPHLADSMKVLGFVQKFGVGLETARRELKRNGNPELEYEVDDSFVLIRVRMRP